MATQKLKIINKLGLHARASAKLIDCAHRYQSSIYLVCKGKKADAKSILNVMTLGASYGSPIEVIAEGKDEKKALAAIVKLINSKFGESA